MYTVSSDGATITKKWQNEFDTQQNAWNDLVRVDKNTIALTYAGVDSDGYIQTFDIGTSDNAGPAITANSINYENSQFTIMLDEAAYNTNEGSGDLEVSDFTLSITGGAATLSSATPTSISKIGDSQFVLGFSLSGTANGSEVLKASALFSFDRYSAGKFSSYDRYRGSYNNREENLQKPKSNNTGPFGTEYIDCLLYTSDAADE